jgi:hypothetical protein
LKAGITTETLVWLISCEMGLLGVVSTMEKNGYIALIIVFG